MSKYDLPCTYTPCGPTTGLLCIIGLICGLFMEEKGCHGGTLLIRIVQEGNSRRGSRVGAKYFSRKFAFCERRIFDSSAKATGNVCENIRENTKTNVFIPHLRRGEGGGFFPKIDTKHGGK